MISYDYYRVFCTAARLGSFSKAADALLTSQPSVSHIISNLEAQLGCELFIRTGRGIALTAEGRLLYEYAAPGCEQLRLGEEAVKDALTLNGGSIHLGSTEIAMRCRMLDAIAVFHKEKPGIKFKITVGSVSEAVQHLLDGTVELSVAPSPLSIAPPLVSEKIGSFQDILISGNAFPELKDRSIDSETLSRYPLICLAKGTATRAFLEKVSEERGLPLSPDMEPMTSDLILPMVQEGLGIGYLPEPLCRAAMKRGDVFAVPLPEPLPRRSLYLVTHSRRPMSRAAAAFCDFLRSFYPEP